MCSFLYLTLKNSIKDFRFDIHHFPLVKKELIPADTRVKADIIPDSMCITGLKRKTTKQPHIHTCYQFGSKRHVFGQWRKSMQSQELYTERKFKLYLNLILSV